MLRSNSNSPGNPRSKYLSTRKEGLQWEGFAEKEGFNPRTKVFYARACSLFV